LHGTFVSSGCTVCRLLHAKGTGRLWLFIGRQSSQAIEASTLESSRNLRSPPVTQQKRHLCAHPNRALHHSQAFFCRRAPNGSIRGERCRQSTVLRGGYANLCWAAGGCLRRSRPSDCCGTTCIERKRACREGKPKMKATGFSILTIGLITTLSGCTVGPDYKAPRFDVPPKWSELPDSAVSPAIADLSHWWTLFDDPQLTSLIERAVMANKDIKIAEAHIRETRAQRHVASAGFFPQVNAAGSYQRTHTSENGVSGPSAGEGDLFQVGFDVNWERLFMCFGLLRCPRAHLQKGGEAPAPKGRYIIAQGNAPCASS